MTEAEYLLRRPALPPARDYAFLRRRGLELIEALGREAWTDYNVHDPGVTLLELVAYAITDLGRRADYPIADILTELVRIESRVAPRNVGTFHLASEALVTAPITFLDLRKLIVDVPGVRNAWVEKHTSVRHRVDPANRRLGVASERGAEPIETMNGLFDVYIEYDDALVGTPRAAVRSDVVDRILKHRNLCQDVVHVCELEREEIGACAEVELAPPADADVVQAEIFARIRQYVSPPVRFHSLQDLWARGKTTDEILDGPLLEHGFIDDDELSALTRRGELRSSDLIREIMKIDGVVAVRSLRLSSFLPDADEPTRREEWILPLSHDRMRAPAFMPGRSRMIFYKHGLPYFANPKKAGALFEQKIVAELATKLVRPKLDDGKLAAPIPVPEGRPRDLRSYTPIQNELPDAYHTGRNRVPRSATPLRKAQARQLKAYLMLYDQVFANLLAQLAHVKDLFDWTRTTDATYFTRPVDDVVDFDDLDHVEHRHEDDWPGQDYSTHAHMLERVIEEPRARLERRLRFLDHLVSRYCEDFGEYTALMRALGFAADRLVADKRRFLCNYATTGVRRATGFDWRRPQDPDNISGFQHRVCDLLGIEDATRRPLAGHRISIESIGDVDEPKWRFVVESAVPGEDPLLVSTHRRSRSAIEALIDFALRWSGDEGNYQTLNGHMALVSHSEEAGGAPVCEIGVVRDDAATPALREYLARIATAEGFHLIEHVLLRRRTSDDAFLAPDVEDPETGNCPEIRDPYSFRASVVLPAWAGRFRDMRFRRLVETTLRREAPAHVYLRICWVGHEQMREFENRLTEWQIALATRGGVGTCADDPNARSGGHPLPESTSDDAGYTEAASALVSVLERLVTVYPVARLHACDEVDANEPQVTLNHTTLGTI